MVREWRHDTSMIPLIQFPSLLCHFIPEVKVLRDHDGISLSLLIPTEERRRERESERDDRGIVWNLYRGMLNEAGKETELGIMRVEDVTPVPYVTLFHRITP